MNAASDKNLIARILLLSAINSIGWLYSICMFQTIFWKGGDLASHDYGLGTLVPGWILGIIWGALTCFPLSRRLISSRSRAAFLLGGIFAVPATLLIAGLGEGFLSPTVFKAFSDIAASLFRVLTLGGLVPEGRPGTASFLGFCWIVIGIGTMAGFSISGRSDRAVSGRE